MKLLKYFISNIDAILLALVICVNCLRVALGLGETTIILYSLYFLCAAVLLAKYASSFSYILRKNKTINAFFIVVVLIALYALISMTWLPAEKVFLTFLKFLLSLMIGVLAVALPPEKIRIVLDWVIIVNISYSVLLIVIPSMADTAMGSGLNYLNVTLPLGLAMTITLVRAQNSLSNKGDLIMALLWLLVSALFFVVMVRFVARGVLIFPPVIAILIFLFMKKEHKYISWLLIPLFLGSIILFYNYYLQNASDYAVHRMMNLVESSEEEDRWVIWGKALKDIVDNLWFIMGGGIEAFRHISSIHYYPHNIFIQVIGEYGLLGIIISVMVIWNVVKGFVRNKKKAYNAGETDAFYCVIGSYAYYTLTFSKSFSLYDGLPLFLFIAFCLSIFNTLRRTTGFLPQEI